MSNITDGKLVASSVKTFVAEEVKKLNQRDIDVTLAVIIVGEDSASQVYVNNKKKACEELGIVSKQFVLPKDYGQEKLLELVAELNEDSTINGILCQLPLPESYDEKAITEAINLLKDVDAFHPDNVGRLMLGNAVFSPCTPAGVIELLDYYGIDIAGKECVIVGRSNIVGKPLAMMLLQRNGTVTIAHSKTENLAEVTLRADILVTAVGKPKFITADMVKDGAAVIDVGINRVTGKLCGDVDFENVSRKTSWITPAPGGVGVMTIAMLMLNTLRATIYQN